MKPYKTPSSESLSDRLQAPVLVSLGDTKSPEPAQLSVLEGRNRKAGYSKRALRRSLSHVSALREAWKRFKTLKLQVLGSGFRALGGSAVFV